MITLLSVSISRAALVLCRPAALPLPISAETAADHALSAIACSRIANKG